MWFRAFLLIGLLYGPTAARAQTWTACIDPNSGGPTTEGFLAIRAAASVRAAANPGRQGRFGSVIYNVRHSVEGSSADPLEFQVVMLELMRAGISAGWIRSESVLPYQGLPRGAQNCFDIVAEEGVPSLWHYWGPFFPLGSAVIPEGQRSTLEYLVIGYEPRRHLFRINGFADTLGSVEDNAALGAARADAVARELIRLGVRWQDIEQNSDGELTLSRPTADGVAEPFNRRVNIDVLSRPDPAR